MPDKLIPPGHVLCDICGGVTDDWVHAQCRPCSDLPGAVLLAELGNRYSQADERLGEAIDLENALTHALAAASEARAHVEFAADALQANHAGLLELVKQIRAAGLAAPVCECGHAEGKHSPTTRCLETNCSCVAFTPQPALSFVSMRRP